MPLEIKTATREPKNLQSAARLTIDHPDEKTGIKGKKQDNPAQTETVVKQVDAVPGKLSGLAKIREQFKTSKGIVTGPATQSLDEELLKQGWKKFIQQLKNDKNSAAQSFELAILRIKDENCFDVIAANNLEQKFIDKERLRASAFLQQELNNKNIQFSIFIEEPASDRETADRPLTSREQFQKMSEQYPLVKELKDRLKLELDY